MRTAWLWLLLLVVPVASAQKKAWDIPDEERIARRVDLQSIRARAPKEKAGEYALLGRSVIDGKRNPELFLPWELYRDAILTYFAMPEDWRARHRALADDELRVITDPIVFWETFEKASEPYILLLRREQMLVDRLNAAPPSERRAMIQQIESEAAPQCAARASGLAAVEKAIGRETLYQFFYEIVAVTHTSTSTGAEQPEQLRFVSRGCR